MKKLRVSSLIRVFAVRIKKQWVLGYPLSVQRTRIRLGVCPGWSEYSLGTQVVSFLFFFVCFFRAATDIRGRWQPLSVVPMTFLLNMIWATSRENLSSEVCDQVRLKPVCSATDVSWRVAILKLATTGTILSKQRTIKVLIRLHGCAGWSEPLLFAYGIRQVFSWWGSILMTFCSEFVVVLKDQFQYQFQPTTKINRKLKALKLNFVVYKLFTQNIQYSSPC